MESGAAKLPRRATVAAAPARTDDASGGVAGDVDSRARVRHMSVAAAPTGRPPAPPSGLRDHVAALFPVRRHFGAGIGELLSGGGERGPTLPRILVFMCEYLLGYAEALVADGRSNVEGDLRQLFQVMPDATILSVVRARFDDGDFYDCQSPECVFRLLKAFVRELPHPLIPVESFATAMAIVDAQMQWAVTRVRSHPHYRALLASLSDTVATEIDAWVSAMADGEPAGSANAIADDGVVDCARPLQGVVRRLALNAHAPLSAVEDLFFAMPKTHRDALEYLGVFAAKMDLTARRTSRSLDFPGPVLCDLASALAPFVVRPSVWAAATRGEEHRMRARQSDFLLLFFHFVKKKHNLLAAAERAALDMAEGDLVASLIATVVPTASQASPGFSPALILRNPAQMPKGIVQTLQAAERSPASTRGGGTGSGGQVTPQISRPPSNPGSAVMSRAQSSESLPGAVDASQSSGGSRGAQQQRKTWAGKGRRPYFEVWVDALPITPLALAAPLQSINSYHSRTMARATDSGVARRQRRLHPFLVGDDDAPDVPVLVPAHAGSGAASKGHSPAQSSSAVVSSRSSLDMGQSRETRTAEDLIGDLLAHDPERQVRVVFPPRLADTSVENEGRVVCGWLPLEPRAVSFLRDAPRFLQWLTATALPCPASHTGGASTDPALRPTPPVDLTALLAHPSWDSHVSAADSAARSSFRSGSNGSGSAVVSSQAPTRGLSMLLEGQGSKGRTHARSFRGGSSSETRAGRTGTIVVAANYDRPLAFPRTQAEGPAVGGAGAQRASFARFLDGMWALGAPSKAPFVFDREMDLLNHRPPQKTQAPAPRCEQCDVALSVLGARRTTCAYCGRTLCGACCDRTFVVPGHVLATGDFSPRRVCAACEAHLQAHLYSPLLELDRLAPAAAQQIGRQRVDRIRADRERITRAIYYCMAPHPPTEHSQPRRSMGSAPGTPRGASDAKAGSQSPEIVPDHSFGNFSAYLKAEGVPIDDPGDFTRGCPSLPFMLSLLPPRIASFVRQYPMTTGPRVSLADVCEMQTRHFVDVVDRLRRLYMGHTQRCHYCRAAANARRCCARDRCLWAMLRRNSVSANEREDVSVRKGSAPLSFRSFGAADSPALCRVCLQYSHACCVDTEGGCCVTCAATPEERVRVLLDAMDHAGVASTPSSRGETPQPSTPSTPALPIGRSDGRGRVPETSPLWDDADKSHF